MQYNIFKFILFLGIISALVSCDTGPKTIKRPKTVKNTSEVDGFQVFKKNCKTCHGADGSLGLNGAKDLRVSTLSIEQRIETITHGKGVMTAFETILSPEEIKAVAEYTTTLK